MAAPDGGARRPGARSRFLYAVSLVALLLAVACTGGSSFEGGPAYVAEIEQFRTEREKRLGSPDGWLSLVGLHWLEAGESRFGSDPANEIVLPEGAAPPLAGRLAYDGEQVRLLAEPGVELLVDDAPLGAERVLIDDSAGKPEVVSVGRLDFHVIARGGRRALRVKDPESPTRLGFEGLTWFPVDPVYRVEARLRAYDEPRQRRVETVAGGPAEMLAPGLLEFELDGKRRTLEPFVVKPGDTALFIMFRDGTSGRGSYGAGRFLSATLEDGRAVLDFNRSTNPPCAYTAYATCPLPPAGNRLDVEVRAGEGYPGDRH
jgi:uncharacterized protein (DUF1684 family)